MGTNIKTLGVLNAIQLEFQDRLDYLAKEAIFFFIALIIIVVFGSEKLNKVNNKPYSYNVSLESSFRSHHHLVDVKELEFH